MAASLLQSFKTFTEARPVAVGYGMLLGSKLAFFIILACLLWVAGRLLARPAQPVFPRATWGMGSVAEIFVSFLAFQAFSITIKGPHLTSQKIEAMVSVWATIEYLFLFVLVWVVLRALLNRGLADVGWRMGLGEGTGQSCVKGILFVGVLAGLTNFLYWTEILERSSKIIQQTKIAELFDQGLFSIIHILLVLVISPVAEETFYRGFLYPVARNRVGKYAAIALVSAFFAAVHLQWGYFWLLFLLGWAAAVAYEKTKSLMAPYVIHAAYNAMVLIGLFSY